MSDSRISSFVLDLATLPIGAFGLEVESGAGELGLTEADWSGPIRGNLVVQRNGDKVTVHGSLEATGRLECVRCLRVYDAPVRAPFDAFAERAGTSSRREETELDRDDYMRFHDGRRLDLREDVREALLLELPMSPRCRDDCAGLCPRCGADLNEGPCGCEHRERETSSAG